MSPAKLNPKRLPLRGALVTDAELSALAKLSPDARRRFNRQRLAALRARGAA